MAIFKLSEADRLIFYQDLIDDTTECFFCCKPLGLYGQDKLIVHWMGADNIFFHADCALTFANRLTVDSYLASRANEKMSGAGYPYQKVLEAHKKRGK